MNRCGYLAFIGLWLSANTLADTSVDRIVQGFLQGNFVKASLMSDADVIKLGIWNFDPNEYAGFENEDLGSTSATEFRNDLKQISAPFRWSLMEDESGDKLWLLTKAAYMELKQSAQIVPSQQSSNDKIVEKNALLGVGIEYEKALGNHWKVETGGYATWMRYTNKVDYRTPESKQIEPFLDGVLSDIEVDLWMAEPMLGASYNWGADSDRYQLFSHYHYMQGKAINADLNAHKAEPEAWYWANGFAWEMPLAGAGWKGHKMWFQLSRIDVGGDLPQELGTSNYYEAGVGWIVDVNDALEYLDNLGMGINLNYGSSLRGGTLILLYNFDGFR